MAALLPVVLADLPSDLAAQASVLLDAGNLQGALSIPASCLWAPKPCNFAIIDEAADDAHNDSAPPSLHRS